MPHVSDALSRVLDRLERAYERGHVVEPTLPTGLRAIDAGHGGLDRHGWLLRGHPDAGTTALALRLCLAALGGPDRPTVLFLTNDLSAEVLVERLLAQVTGISLSAIQEGDLSSSRWQRVSEGLGVMARMDLRIEEVHGRSASEVLEEVWSTTCDPGWVVIDSLDRCAGRGRFDLAKLADQRRVGIVGVARTGGLWTAARAATVLELVRTSSESITISTADRGPVDVIEVRLDQRTMRLVDPEDRPHALRQPPLPGFEMP